MLKSEFLEKKRRWFQEKYDEETWEEKWNAWVESNPEIPGEDPPVEEPPKEETPASKKKATKRKS